MEVLNTIIIDTSTDQSLVVFARGVDILLKILLPPGGQSSRHLIKMIAEGIEQLRWSPASLQAVAVSIGPGSYTGIRVGVAAAKGLAFPRSLPLIGFCSLEGFISEEQGRFASVIDAKMGGSYVLLQERVGEEIILHSEPRLIPREDLAAYLVGYPKQEGPDTGYPSSEYLAKLVTKKRSDQPLELLYLRTPQYQKTAIAS